MTWKVIPQKLEALAEEASKYKSAEEFVDLFNKNGFPKSFVFALPEIKVKGKRRAIPVKGTFITNTGKVVKEEETIKLASVGQKVDATRRFIQEKYGTLENFYNQAVKEAKAKVKEKEPKPSVLPEWQEAEKEASEDIKQGRLSPVFSSAEKGINYLRNKANKLKDKDAN